MTDLLSQGGELMMMGMGAVFVFLILLVFVTSFMSSVVNRLFPEKPVIAVATATAAATPESDPQLLAVIEQAIQQHRTRRK